MAGTSASSPYIKDEPEDHLFSSHNSNQRFMASQQGFPVAQQQFNHFGSSHGGSINPNDLSMGGNGVAIPNGAYSTSMNNNFGAHVTRGMSTSAFEDDELLEGLGGHHDVHSGQMQGGGQDFNGMPFEAFQNLSYGHNGQPSLSIDPSQINGGYSNTPDGDPIQSPFQHNFNSQAFQQMRHQPVFGSSLASPHSYGSPILGSEMHNGATDAGAFAKQQRPRLNVQRRTSSTRSPLTPKTPAISSLNIGSAENSNYQSQPIRTQSHRHQKTLSGQWEQTPGSLTSFPGSDFSPIQGVHPNPQISDILKGASMPTKLNNGHQVGSAPALQSQEMKRRRRRESHNLVERRRRDNINERIQELSHLVPAHRLDDEKVRKALNNNGPLSPTLAGLSVPPSGMSPPQATSGLAGPGARRATAGNITTGIPIEEKDKGPNKGDILNGAVSWTRDLMWMLHAKLHQQEEMVNMIHDLGGNYTFEETEEEKRMRSELMDSMMKNDGSKFQYSRAPGTGLRVPRHTDVKGDPVGSSAAGQLDTSLSPENHSTGDAGNAGMGGAGQYWSGHNSGGSGAGSISFKEEDEYGMDLTQ